jgi:hypothetical protein
MAMTNEETEQRMIHPAPKIQPQKPQGINP